MIKRICSALCAYLLFVKADVVINKALETKSIKKYNQWGNQHDGSV